MPDDEEMRYRSLLAYLIGIVTGFFWLFPNLGEPQSTNTEQMQLGVLRIVRLLLPLAIWGLVGSKRSRQFVTLVFVDFRRVVIHRGLAGLLIVLVALQVFPLVAGLLSSNIRFIISASLPTVVSAFVLLGIALVDEQLLENWCIGIGFSAAILLGYGISQSGFEASTYFGRGRVLMGFMHPIHTASAVLASLVFLGLVVRKMRVSILVRWMLVLLLMVVFAYLLLISQSRNTLILLIVGIVFTVIAKLTPPLIRHISYWALLIVITSLYVFSVEGVHTSYWMPLDDIVSRRLTLYSQDILSYLSQDWSSILIVPWQSIAAEFGQAQEFRGFAAVDSVYLSFLLNYGPVALMAFIVMMLFLAATLASSREKAVGFGVLSAVTVFFALDAQGATSSNLIVFALFAYAVRVATHDSCLRDIQSWRARHVYRRLPVPEKQMAGFGDDTATNMVYGR